MDSLPKHLSSNIRYKHLPTASPSPVFLKPLGSIKRYRKQSLGLLHPLAYGIHPVEQGFLEISALL
jgi:hypothetical protein